MHIYWILYVCHSYFSVRLSYIPGVGNVDNCECGNAGILLEKYRGGVQTTDYYFNLILFNLINMIWIYIKIFRTLIYLPFKRIVLFCISISNICSTPIMSLNIHYTTCDL